VICPTLLHGHTVGEDADEVQDDAAAGAERLVHRVSLVRLHADDLDRRPHRLHVARDARDEPPAADGNEDRVHVPQLVAQDLLPHRPLPRNHQLVVERMHEGAPGGDDQLVAVPLRLGVVVALQNHFRAELRDGLDLDRGRRLRPCAGEGGGSGLRTGLMLPRTSR
jgi:hypothetical protein